MATEIDLNVPPPAVKRSVARLKHHPQKLEQMKRFWEVADDVDSVLQGMYDAQKVPQGVTHRIAIRELQLRQRHDKQQVRANVNEGLTMTDALTGIGSRRLFYEELNRELKRSERTNKSLGIIAAEIRRFKPYNETYGHNAGDEALKTVARVLGETVRATDVAARLGGDEFAVLLPNVDPRVDTYGVHSAKDGLAMAALRILEHMHEANITYGGVELDHVHLDLGVTLARETEGANSFYERADKASLIAKKCISSGENTIVMASREEPDVNVYELASFDSGQKTIQYKTIVNAESLLAA